MQSCKFPPNNGQERARERARRERYLVVSRCLSRWKMSCPYLSICQAAAPSSSLFVCLSQSLSDFLKDVKQDGNGDKQNIFNYLWLFLPLLLKQLYVVSKMGCWIWAFPSECMYRKRKRREALATFTIQWKLYLLFCGVLYQSTPQSRIVCQIFLCICAVYLPFISHFYRSLQRVNDFSNTGTFLFMTTVLYS